MRRKVPCRRTIQLLPRLLIRGFRNAQRGCGLRRNESAVIVAVGFVVVGDASNVQKRTQSSDANVAINALERDIFLPRRLLQSSSNAKVEHYALLGVQFSHKQNRNTVRSPQNSTRSPCRHNVTLSRIDHLSQRMRQISFLRKLFCSSSFQICSTLRRIAEISLKSSRTIAISSQRYSTRYQKLLPPFLSLERNRLGFHPRVVRMGSSSFSSSNELKPPSFSASSSSIHSCRHSVIRY